MWEFLIGVWDKVAQLSIALGVIAGICMSVYIIITKTHWFNEKIETKKEKHRMETCPQKAVIDAFKAKQDIKVEELHTQLLEANQSSLQMHGSHIVLFCIFVKFRGFLDRYERQWLQDSFDSYQKKGGNHGVEDIFKETMLLPECPPRSRRKTDI